MQRLILLAALAASPLQAQTLTGPATAIDGRTLDMTGTVIVLAHVDTPEIRQACRKDGQDWACGAEATKNLGELVAQGPVTCAISGATVDGMALATCQTDNIDIGREMVRRGMALTLDGAPGDYVAAAGIARRMGFGLWAAEYRPPAEWRAAHPEATLRFAREQAPTSGATGRGARQPSERRYTNKWGCAIKGNRSRRGEWIYHLPGQTYYEGTRPEELFCTEREAQAAGYRRSKE
jgi:endonuclease YncB( thermonuclease family)